MLNCCCFDVVFWSVRNRFVCVFICFVIVLVNVWSVLCVMKLSVCWVFVNVRGLVGWSGLVWNFVWWMICFLCVRWWCV